MEFLLFSLEKLFLSIIIGGGIVMATSVRPQFLQLMKLNHTIQLTSSVEKAHIQAWNGYNRLALISTVLLSVLEIINLLTGSISFGRILILLVMGAALARKMIVDNKLKQRVDGDNADQVILSTVQKASHREVELLSILILILSIIFMIFFTV